MRDIVWVAKNEKKKYRTRKAHRTPVSILYDRIVENRHCVNRIVFRNFLLE